MEEETKQQEAERPEKTYSAAEYTALQEQLDAARTSLKETAEKLSSFEKMDIDGSPLQTGSRSMNRQRLTAKPRNTGTM